MVGFGARQARRVYERICPKCKRLFMANRVDKRFCTSDCRVNAYRGRKSKWEREIEKSN